ncbi:MAG: hypothetical protein MAG795_00952 [Candidatus Woesearchaeota archaeon]|nr:hypothetical protein [Candidatus Woesearchaeota archaeon]
MIIDLKKDANYRGYSFEIFAERYIRKKRKNNFIFRTDRFKSLKQLVDYYRLDLSGISNIEIIEDYYYNVDIIEFVLRDTDTRRVDSVGFYEVKTKVHKRKRLIEIYKKTDERYKRLIQLGFIVKLVNIILFENWRFSINIYNYKDFKYVVLRNKKFDKNLISDY